MRRPGSSPSCASLPPSSTGRPPLSGAHSPSASQPLCVTIGEPAGIGPDIILTAWAERKRLKLPPFFVIGDPALLARRALAMSLAVKISAIEAGDQPGPFGNGLPVAALSGGDDRRAGQALACRRTACHRSHSCRGGCRLCRKGQRSCHLPDLQGSLVRGGLHASGPPEFLAELAREKTGRSVLPVMMIAGRRGANGAGDDPHPAGGSSAHAQYGSSSSRRPHRRRPTSSGASASTSRGWRSPGSIRMPAKAAPSAARTSTSIAPAVAHLRAEGIEATGPLRPTRCSTEAAPDTMRRSACITTRR